MTLLSFLPDTAEVHEVLADRWLVNLKHGLPMFRVIIEHGVDHDWIVLTAPFSERAGYDLSEQLEQLVDFPERFPGTKTLIGSVALFSQIF